MVTKINNSNAVYFLSDEVERPLRLNISKTQQYFFTKKALSKLKPGDALK